jgi:23S rRNA pseudouridine1911/1915/1917 synthase
MVNGEVVKESKYVVRKNDKVVFRVTGDKLRVTGIKPTNTPLRILYNDHGLLIIDKPPGMTVHPGAGFKGETLVSALLYHFQDIKLVGEEGRPGIVHRLDKDTSGIILVAKTQEMYEFLKDAFAERKIKKEYIALVAGKVEKPHGFINTPIGRSKTDFRKYSTKNMVEAKESLTEYQLLESLESEGGLDLYSLIRVKLHTGRTHQIRVHMASIGHPLIGDALYGSKKTQIKGLSRQFLHAKKIEVQLPDKTWIEAESELADDLRNVLKDLDSKAVKQL